MPVKNLPPKDTTASHYKSISYETLAASWLLNDGWETYLPLVDHGMKTDLIIADGNNFYRIQIKSVDTNDECFVVDNKWSKSAIDYVVFFSRQGDWGYITPPFPEDQRKLNSPGHIRFHQHPKNFTKAFAMA
ncbi:hypothetical protein C0039_07565 [Pseudohalioglobus lutimaris]|uniref:Uncharacterized protein n=2 Tax=Pseudohalioglobus lutimaris TaxID=1737061 RepID=A0A2N5X4W6_9GAMM|nr:hypothetical protein C0039_07565 [Pseudohalioglobus lutimaris]